MAPGDWLRGARAMAGTPGLLRIDVDAGDWHAIAQDAAASGARLLALWGSGVAPESRTVNSILLVPGTGAVVAVARVNGAGAPFPGIEDVYPPASRMQRAMRDMLGIKTTDADDRPWVRHAAWPADVAPLATDASPEPIPDPVDDYPFVRVEGDGVHEIAVGPVHAGIIEPGHFRFSVVGEKVLRLEERLGYVHKGIERRFREMAIRDGHRLAARVSGDTAVAFAWAYCEALEGMAGTVVPERAAWLRALALELERAANHLGDLGALGNDAGFAFGLSQFLRLKELLLRTTHRALGQRYLNEFVVPGGVRVDLDAEGAAALDACAGSLVAEVGRLRDIYDEHAGVRDRFAGAGAVPPELAARLGLLGLAGRASGQAFDLRCDLPAPPYPALRPRKCGAEGGDVLARVAVRFDELFESLRLVRSMCTSIPSGGPIASAVAEPDDRAFGVGLVEGWRGPVAIALEAGDGGTIRRCRPHDPSWNNWPVLEHAIIGNIVPDFPLINKSFNLSYSGHDL